MSIVRITDGTTTITFNSSAHAVWKINSPAGPTVDQSLECVLPTGSGALTRITDVEQLFATARRRYDPATHELINASVPKVFVTVDLTELGTDIWRTEVFDGRATPTENVHIYANSGYTRFLLSFTHKPRWEGAYTQLPIGNVNGSANTSGLVINNHSDGSTAESVFRVNGGLIIGNIPGRARLELTTIPADNTGTFYTGVINDGTYTGVIQCEASTTGSLVVDAGRSNGQARLVTLAGGTTDLVGLVMTLPNAFMAALQGRRARTVIVYSPNASYTDVQGKLEIYYRGVTKVADTPWSTFGALSGIHDFETMPIPPKFVGGTSYDDHELWLRLRKASAGSINLTFDFLQMMPALPFRKIVPAGYGLPQNSILVDDGIEELVYSTALIAGGSRGGHYQAFSTQWFELIPQQSHTFTVITANMLNVASPSRQVTAKLFYRPARTTL